MREIKFRAWDTLNKKMYDNILKFDIKGIGVCMNSKGNRSVYEDWSYVYMQYTGLKDKNGTPIFESDIVAYIRESIYHFLDREGVEPSKGIWYDKKEGVNNTPAFSEKVIYGRKCEVVKWQEDMTGFYPFADSPDNCGHCGGGYKPEMFEVIGNVWESPELLTKST